MASIFDWSVTAADNDDADSDINWLEGQAGNTVNNSARAMMAKVAALVKSLRGVLVTAGSDDNYTLSLDYPPSSLATKGWVGVVRFNRANTTATPNFEISGLTAVDIVNNQGLAPAIGEILANSLHLVVYDPNTSRIRLVTLDGPSVLTSDDITDFDTAVNTLIGSATFTASDVTDFSSAVNALLVTIDEMAAETAPSLSDYIPLIDVSEGATAQNKMLVSNFLKVIDLLTDVGTPAQDDKLVIWDESASEVKTVSISQLTDGWTRQLKTTTESRSSTTTLANDTDLTIASGDLDVNSTYEVEWDVTFDAPATPDFKFDIETDLGVGGMQTSIISGHYTNATAAVALFEEKTVQGSSLFTDLSITGAGFQGRIQLRGYITFGANAVELQFRWAQNASNATASRVYAGSFVRYRKVA